MKLVYDFGEKFEYEPDAKKLEDALIKILCRECKYKLGSLYSEDGAYQMACYIVHNYEVEECMGDALEEELKEYFENDAYMAFNEANELEEEEIRCFHYEV